MKLHPQPAATAAPRIVHIAPGQVLWACLVPGTILHATQGEVAIRFAPCIHEHAIESLAQTVLKAGTHLPLAARHQATWAQFGNATRGPAEIKMVESAPEPGLVQKAWALARVMLVANRRQSHKSGTRDTLHPAR